MSEPRPAEIYQLLRNLTSPVVAITSQRASGVLAVPVNALLAVQEGGYALQVVGSNGRTHLVAVGTGLFDDADGLVQVTGAGIAEGTRVAVPQGL